MEPEVKFQKIVDPTRYSFVEAQDNEGKKITGIRLEDLEYKNLIYEYSGKIQFGKQEIPDGEISLGYTINIFTLGEAIEGTPETPEFKKLCGNILMDLLAAQLENDPTSIKFIQSEI